MERVHVAIEGVPPGLLMNHPRVMRKGYSIPESEEEQARDRLYLTADGTSLMIPSTWLYRGLVLACGRDSFKGRDGRKRSLGPAVAGDLQVSPGEISLGTLGYDISLERVKNLGGGAVIRARPWVKEWSARFDVIWETSQLGKEFGSGVLPNLLAFHGESIGLGDFRPRKKGPYGKYKVVQIGG